MIDLVKEIKEAMKSGDKDKLRTFRFIKAEFQKYESQGADFKVGEKEEMDILRTMIKQREKSIQEYETSGRTDLADAEKKEIEIISEYLPKEPSDAEIYAVILEFLGKQDIDSVVLEKKDMGKVMAYLKTKLPTASGKKLSELIKTLIKE
jgi:uncharacterized protein YqeY